ncbi:alpha-amylase/4-alpha-glucanotransferase domain-containing protein [Treponema primitia]|uniref:alpha-amylase/4-alpha-glucanotransferase domain-containing protein n=1 Tax=Treponema primitia TaxID=88058 RepID=UPI0002554E9C|nr:alpha-amylase/4-alpha-glucanotransferase domain-containing protein [Treponema primitia]
MKDRLSIVLGSHNHIPYGAGDDEGEYIYTTRLKPFIQTLNQYPKIPAVLHYSGVLLNWLEGNHPELTMVLGDLISRKQVEILGGGFYEPMMPLIPQTDKIGQIEMLSAYLRKKFGKRPQGCWIPEAAWEQQLVGILNTCGMNYTFLEEEHFVSAGLSGLALCAPCISENQGKITTVFPLSARLCKAFATHDTVFVLENLLKEFSPSALPETSPGALLTVFLEQLYTEDAGESPETSYGRFFEALSRFSSDLTFTTPGKFYKTQEQLKKAYFPGDQERKFLINYPESNGIYAKMMFTHTLINQLRGDKSRKQNAREELWKTQGYALFCDTEIGASGGIHRAFLRKAVYKALLGAEKICRNQGKFTPSLLAFDFDLDGCPEYLFQDRNINCYVKSAGASIFELDYLPKTWNYLDTFSGAPYRRTAFADHLTPPEYSFKDAVDHSSEEARFEGTRFCGKENYELVDMDRSHGRACFHLPSGKNSAKDGFYLDLIEMEKLYLLKQDTLSVHYTLINRGKAPAAFKFIPRIDLSFSGDGEELLKVFRSHAQDPEPAIREGAEINNIRGIEFRDIKNELTLSLTADRDFDGWILPIRTQLKIRDLVTDQYQSTCFMPVMVLNLGADERWEAEFKLNISH